jgi:hypothetical protein
MNRPCFLVTVTRQWSSSHFQTSSKGLEVINEHITYSDECIVAYTERLEFLKELKNAGKDCAKQNGYVLCAA